LAVGFAIAAIVQGVAVLVVMLALAEILERVIRINEALGKQSHKDDKAQTN
jgi:uncharacterized membrane protein YciS (DUF1049 family)